MEDTFPRALMTQTAPVPPTSNSFSQCGSNGIGDGVLRPGESSRRSIEPLALGACLALLFLAILAIWPFVDMGVNDDFSYTQIALQTARTGKLLYNGWNTPMIGLQSYWGAEFIKVFGFSFNAVRASVLPFDAGCVILLYLLFRASGLSRALTVFGVCCVTLSPLMLPLETSFMTDVPGLFFLLLCLWSASRIVQARTFRTFLFWSILLTGSGLAGGTIRQTVWVAPLVILPLIFLQFRSRWRMASVGILWAVALAGAVSFNSWFNAQPYTVSLPLFNAREFSAHDAVWNFAALCLEFVIVLFPALCFAIALNSRLPRKIWTLALCCSVSFTTLLAAVHYGRPKSPQIPLAHLGGNLVTQWGLLGVSTEVLGNKPVIVPFLFQCSLIAASLACFLALVMAAGAQLRTSMPAVSDARRRRTLSVVSACLTWSRENVILASVLLYLIAYLPLAGSRALVGVAFDRYLVPLFPFAVLGILLVVGRAYRRRPPMLAILVLIVFSLFGIATAHDFFARSRARLSAADEVTNSGVPRLQVSAGVEYDGWTELLHSGHINDGRMTNPPHQFVSVAGRKFPTNPRYWFWDLTPSVDPLYVVVLSPQKDLLPSRYAPVPYVTWLPPRDAEILIQRAPPRDRWAAPPKHPTAE